jgi:hypothetical protein
LLDVLEPEKPDYADLSIVFPFYSMDISQLLNTVACQPGTATVASNPHVPQLAEFELFPM